MYNDDTRKKLQDIISGKHITWQADTCTAARNFLCSGFSPNTTVKKDFDHQSAIKEEQAKELTAFIDENTLWLQPPDETERFLTQGGEAEIYFSQQRAEVVKVNDAVYYATWLDFFTSLLIHNLLFEETRYILKGFILSGNILKAVLQQDFVISDNAVDLKAVKSFLEYNGFENTKRNDYYNKELGLILEDIHDENVIMNSGVMFFIDTVFYVNLAEA
jgi:hypothetical protein